MSEETVGVVIRRGHDAGFAPEDRPTGEELLDRLQHATAKPAPNCSQPGSSHLDPERAEAIAGLRELADFLETHPGLPAPKYETVSPYITGGDEEQRAEVDRIAGILDVTAREGIGGHYVAARQFGGIAYEARAITADRIARYMAASTYHGSVQP